MASRGIPLDTSAVVSTVMEGILYGFSVLMFMGTIWALTYKRRLKDINRTNAVVAVLLLILSTAHMVIDVIRIEEGLVTYRDTFPGGPPAFFADVAQNTFVNKNVIYTLQTMLGDGMVSFWQKIYRCYVVWKSLLIIIIPSVLWLGSTVSGFFAVHSVSQATSEAGNIFAKATGQWITTFYALTLATNLSASGLLGYRIWMVERNVSAIRATKGSMMPILRVLVDAAVLYSVALLSALVCFVEWNNGQYVMLDMIMPIISITFYMVIIRIAINKKTTHNYISTRGGMTSGTAGGISQQYVMKPLEVHVSQLTYRDNTSAYGTVNHDQPSTKELESVEGEHALCNRYYLFVLVHVLSFLVFNHYMFRSPLYNIH
ncbi:uncharacterized protein EDB91DRAFT_1252708 [Suillus paluster]|uniref:uncharacterized protein n=1 Tax=Suillus paluster TaxID=48578 RepID=UPI001B87F443|nr:uncharacterized protein EDB91DRAFT_1252708 [Suillus paluster]KAG1730237.1 hypothetical protein EDB91DRAFT_1252708 [Suillus paluster]